MLPAKHEQRQLVGGVACYNNDAAVSPARLVRGLIGAHNERPHGDSKVPPYSVKARLGLMRSAFDVWLAVQIEDCTLAEDSPYRQVCGLRSDKSTSLIKMLFQCAPLPWAPTAACRQGMMSLCRALAVSEGGVCECVL